MKWKHTITQTSAKSKDPLMQIFKQHIYFHCLQTIIFISQHKYCLILIFSIIYILGYQLPSYAIPFISSIVVWYVDMNLIYFSSFPYKSKAIDFIQRVSISCPTTHVLVDQKDYPDDLSTSWLIIHLLCFLNLSE